MPNYKRADYGKNPHAGANRNNAKARGWGSGWPNAQTSKMKTVSAAGVRVSVRREIAELVETLLLATEAMGYNVLSGQTWGFANRPIRGTSTASNHSWGLAVDINSLANPMQSTFKSNIPPKIVAMWEACGFYWGGRYENRPDAMHFEFLRSPGDVAALLAKAKAFLAKALGQTPAPAPEQPTPDGKKLPVLSEGDRHQLVPALKRFFGIDDADDKFGSALDREVRGYQREHGLTVDGAVGPQTWRRITSALKLPGWRV